MRYGGGPCPNDIPTSVTDDDDLASQQDCHVAFSKSILSAGGVLEERQKVPAVRCCGRSS